MKKQILYLHGRPSSHFLHRGLANSLGVDSEFVDKKYRWQDQNFGPIKNFYAWFVNAFYYRKYVNYDFILLDGLHFSPIIAKKIGVLPKRIKIISHMGNQLPYFMLSNQLPLYSRILHKWLFNNYDYIFCEGDMIKEIIIKVNPNIKTPLLSVFTGPLNSRVELLRKLKPEFKNYNIITIASGPGEGRIYYKGLDIMIGSFIKAKKYLPLLKYYILGEWSNEDIKYLSATYRSEEFENIFFVGNKPDMTDYLKYIQNSDLSIHLARGDAFPGSTTEAMHAGVPVIISNYTGTKQILNQVNSNLIVNLSQDELAEKIIWYFNLPIEEKMELSSKLKEISIYYTEENAIKLYKETFNKINTNETNNI
ncbi:MAG: glycosyltransferase [Bacteroidota bacterium]